MRTLMIITAALLLAGSGCKKQEPELKLPPLTHEGKNILACKINGEIFIAEGEPGGGWSQDGVIYRFTKDSAIYLSGQEEEKPLKAYLSLSFIYSKAANVFKLLQYEKRHGTVILPVDEYVLAESEFNTNEEHTGTVTVTYFQADIIAGTFEFEAVDSRGELVHVTDGRFDLKKSK
ncbi:MAG: hypothetical protein WD077_03425 [Bacteroidia bacterium]